METISFYWTTVVVALGATVMAFAVTGWLVWRRLKSMVAELTDVQAAVLPELERLQAGIETASAEWERIVAGEDATDAGGGERASSHNA